MRDNSTARDPKRYERVKLVVGLVNLLIYVLVPSVVLVSGLSVWLRDVISGSTGGFVVLGAIVYIVFASVVLEVFDVAVGVFFGACSRKTL